MVPAVDELEQLRAEQARLAALGPPNPKGEKKEKKKKERKRSREGREDKSPREEPKDLEVGQKELSTVFGGTGLDPDPKRRGKLIQKAKKMSKSKKKRKQKKSGSSKSSSSTSSRSSSTPSSDLRADGLFDEEKKIHRIWRKYPGVLTAQTLSEVRQHLLTGTGTVWSVEHRQVVFASIFLHYGRSQLVGKMQPVVQQEAVTLCLALGCIIQGKIASAGDVLSQRLKALESNCHGAHWSVSRHMELVRVDNPGMSEEGEALAAARLAREEDKLKSLMGRPAYGKGGEASQAAGKTRKGKDYKGTGKGPSNDGGKSKGGKDDSKKPWEKKKD